MANTTAPQTIARTATRRITKIKAENLRCLCYELSSNFVAFETDGSYAWRAVAEGRAKLSTDPRGGYTIRLHSNCWFRLIP
jgi:hypothetical protein